MSKKTRIEDILIKRKQEKKVKRKLTINERRRQVKNWCTFYRRNWNIYAKYELGMTSLHFFQEIILFFIGISDVFYLMCGRGLSKTFTSGLAAVIKCCLYPYSEVVLTATTIKTAKKMVKDKIENEICDRFSPKLKWLKDNGYIIFKYDQEEIIIKFLFNNSWIKVLPEQDSSRGERTCFLLFEECRLLKKSSVDSIFLPMRHARVPRYRLLDEYKDDPRLIERAKIIYLTSTRYKNEWFWTQWKKSVNNAFDNTSKLKYNIFAGDILTAIDCGFITKEDVEIAKGDVSEIDFRMEYLNEPQGEIEGSYYTLEMFQENRILKRSFVPPTYEEYIATYLKGEIPFFRSKNDREVRAIYVDFAFTDSTSYENGESDNTVIGCMAGFPDESGLNMLRNTEYMETYSGGDKDKSILRIRELFYLYEADVLVVDLRNGGEDRWIDLSKPYYHEGLGIHMNGFGIYSDDMILSFFCDKGKVENLRSRTVDDNAIPVTIPVIGTPERNNNYHIAMKNALRNHKARFLIDERSAKDILEKDKSYLVGDSNVKKRQLLGYVQSDFMILEEAVKLKQVVKKGFISLEVTGSSKRDRIVATEYANYFFYLLELEIQKQNTQTEFCKDDWIVWG